MLSFFIFLKIQQYSKLFLLRTIQHPWLKEFHLFVLDNLQNTNLNNSELAIHFNMSERAFYQKIKKLTGLTPNHYIRTIRLKKANELLKTGEYKLIKEVARQVGFSKVSYFSLLFEKMYGIRPSKILLLKSKFNK